jgi:curved DNA-binding protein CbpA
VVIVAPVSDPYTTLGVSPSASEAEVRSAYRRMVQLHHPDHNGGSPDSARRFEEVQDAYARIRTLRAGGPSRTSPPPAPDPDVESRLQAMERELRAARAAAEQALRDGRRAREQARRDAQEAAQGATRDAGAAGRPSDEELGYFSTSDSFTKILDDVAEEFSERLSEAKKSPATQRTARRLADLIDDLGSKLTGEHRDREHHDRD